MYRKVDDFLKDWDKARNGTIQALEAMTDEKLGQEVTRGHNTLGWIGWHLTTAPVYFASLLGLSLTAPGDSRTVPETVSVIVEGYKNISIELHNKVKKTFSDEDLIEMVDQHGTSTPRGEILRTLIDHQTHHRGQMTILIRQAGLKVPGVMGPTREDSRK